MKSELRPSPSVPAPRGTLNSLRTVALAVLAVCGAAAPAWAQSPEQIELQQLRATTQALIESLVDSGVLSREKAAAVMQQAQARAQAATITSQNPPAAPTAEIGADGKRIVRVPYVPESVKKEIREQVKSEVLAQAHTERWGQPGALPEWTDRFSFEGDLRLRAEAVKLPSGNTPPGAAFANGDLTRAADIAFNNKSGIPNFNTQSDFERLRLRARVGVHAKVTDGVEAVVRVATGNTTDRTSTNQTLGQNFNKYSVLFDQAYVRVAPTKQLEFTGGRIPNPFFSTDLVWAEDLNFEGVAAAAQLPLGEGTRGFATLGYFPLTEDSPNASRSRSLVGLQAGMDLKFSGQDQLKLGLALYDYNGIAGERETVAAQYAAPDYAVRHAYGDGLRRRGNTLFRVTAPGDTSSGNIFGLASEFRVLNLTGVLDLNGLLPQTLRLTGDVVKNLAFDRARIQERTGYALADGKDYGLMARLQYGPQVPRHKGQWNAALAYRYLGSDAVLDAFTNSDFGLGGTNLKGWIVSGSYGLFENTWVTARWMSANSIESYAPGMAATGSKIGVDTLQIDLNVRF